MVARVVTVAFDGVEARRVDVEVQLIGNDGPTIFNIVGLPDKAVAESKERVRGAFAGIGLALPAKRIIANLAPADLPKEGSHFDLPIALALMAAMGVIAPDALDGWAAIGELGLDGQIARVGGALAPNLFYGAGIPAAILIIRKAKPAARKGKVLVVNGDATFTPGKAQNHLTDASVQTLADAFHGFADIEKLARVVPVEEIEANAFNLNISRYVQTGAESEAVDVAAEVAKLQDLIAKRNEAEAVMFGHLKRLGYVG